MIAAIASHSIRNYLHPLLPIVADRRPEHTATTTDQSILDFLRRRESASRAQIAEGIGRSREVVHKRALILLESGAICFALVRTPAGREACLYSIRSAA